MDRRVAELAYTPLRWASRWRETLDRFKQAVIALCKPGAGRSLWVGFGVLILLLLALGIVFILRLDTISTHVRVETEITRPRVAAAREMQTHLLSFVGNVRGFRNGNEEALQLAEADAGLMVANLAEYEHLAETEEQRQLAAEVSEQWSALRDHAETLLSSAQASTEDLKKMSAMRITLRQCLNKKVKSEALASQAARTIATLSSLDHSLRISFLLLCGAMVLALFTSAATARTVLESHEALRKSEAFLGEVLNSSLAGVYVYDLQRAAHVFINRRYTVLTGHTLKSLESTDGQTVLSLIHPEDAPRVIEHIERVGRAADGEVFEVEYRFRTADGRWIWGLSRDSVFTRNADGSMRQLIGSALDITARKQAEAGVLARERELKRVLDTAATGLARCSRDLRYVYVNPPFAQMVGLSMEQIVGRTIREVIGELAFELIRPYLDRTLRGERVEYEIEVPLPPGIRYMRVIYTPDEDSDDRIAGFFVSLVDLTPQKSLEREVLRITESERQRVGSELHESICQELIAAGFTAKALQRKLEKERNPLAPDLAALTNAISQTAAHTRQLAHGMNPVVNSPDGLENALRELTTVTADRHDLNCQFQCNSLVTDPDADPVVNTQLFRIAQEAVHNAVRHSGAKRIEVELDQSESEVRLAVKDDGRGLSANADKGSGFGLRSMRYRAGLIHGTLSIQNCEGGGTEVICLVPNREATGETSGR